MSQLANCPLTEATLDRIATVESRLTIAPPNPLIRQMILLQLGFLIALISGVVCLTIGIGLTVGLRTVSDQAGRLWKQHEFQVEQDKARKAYEAETGKAHPEPLSLTEQFAALNAQRAKEEAAAKEQAEAARIQEEQQTKTLQLEAERLDKLKAKQQRLDVQRAEAAKQQQQEAESRRLLQQQSSQADPEMSRSYQYAQEASAAKSAMLDARDSQPINCKALQKLAQEGDEAHRINPAHPNLMTPQDYDLYVTRCAPAQAAR